MVLQKNLLFSGTIKENLRWGNKDATDEMTSRLADSLRQMGTSPSRTDTTRRSSREEPTSPAVKIRSISALRAPC